MKRIQLCLSLVVFLGVLGYTPIAALAQMQQQKMPKGVKPGVIAAMELGNNTNFCHLRFPAIKGSSFGSGKLVLKSPDSGDIVDYYGACDHDPLGKEEAERQTRLWEERGHD